MRVHVLGCMSISYAMINYIDFDTKKLRDFTPDREHGWYRKFEKRNKNKNLTNTK